MTTFQDLKFEPIAGRNNANDVQAYAEFPNGYGASIIRGPHSYGGAQGLYELAVLKDDHLCYDTPVTDDVRGYLSEDDVTGLLEDIAALPDES